MFPAAYVPLSHWGKALPVNPDGFAGFGGGGGGGGGSFAKAAKQVPEIIITDKQMRKMWRMSAHLIG